MTTTSKNEAPAGQGEGNAETELNTVNATTTDTFVDNPREARALRALWVGPVSREAMDRIVGASNSPDIILRCRRKYGLTIPCNLVPFVDRDGKHGKSGVYVLTADDRLMVHKLLASSATE